MQSRSREATRIGDNYCSSCPVVRRPDAGNCSTQHDEHGDQSCVRDGGRRDRKVGVRTMDRRVGGQDMRHSLTRTIGTSDRRHLTAGSAVVRSDLLRSHDHTSLLANGPKIRRFWWSRRRGWQRGTRSRGEVSGGGQRLRVTRRRQEADGGLLS